MKNLFKRWQLSLISLVVLLTFIPYVWDSLSHGKYAEGFEIPLIGILIEILCIPFLIYYFVKKKQLEKRFLTIVMVVLFLATLTGPKLSVYILTLGALISLLFSLFYKEQSQK